MGHVGGIPARVCSFGCPPTEAAEQRPCGPYCLPAAQEQLTVSSAHHTAGSPGSHCSSEASLPSARVLGARRPQVWTLCCRYHILQGHMLLRHLLCMLQALQVTWVKGVMWFLTLHVGLWPSSSLSLLPRAAGLVCSLLKQGRNRSAMTWPWSSPVPCPLSTGGMVFVVYGISTLKPQGVGILVLKGILPLSHQGFPRNCPQAGPLLIYNLKNVGKKVWPFLLLENSVPSPWGPPGLHRAPGGVDSRERLIRRPCRARFCAVCHSI